MVNHEFCNIDGIVSGRARLTVARLIYSTLIRCLSDFNEEMASTVFHSHRMSLFSGLIEARKKGRGFSKINHNSYNNTNNNRFNIVSH